MHKLRRKLPSLNSLTTFEAAARQLSFTRAASELHVSQAAVSRQIRRLEEHLGVTLFHRQHRSLRLTAAGKRFQQAVIMGLEHIAGAADEIAVQRGSDLITVGATIAFATYWLMPRLARFHKAYPEIDVRVRASDYRSDLEAEEIDIAFTCGDSHPVGREAHFLFTEQAFPVCSPAYLQAHPRLQRPEDLLQHTLLHLDDVVWERIGWSPITWQTWLERYCIGTLPQRRGLWFDNYPMIVQAALNGDGVALGWQHLVGDLVACDALVRPIEGILDSQRGFFMLLAGDRPASDATNAFRDWILADVGQDPPSVRHA